MITMGLIIPPRGQVRHVNSRGCSPVVTVAPFKVLWRNQFVVEATYEAEEDKKKRYPNIFESGEILN